MRVFDSHGANCSTRARLRFFAAGESASAEVETALSFLLMMTCVLGIIEFCMMTYTYSVYADATRQGVRYATVHGADSNNCSGPTNGCGDPTGANVSNAVTAYASKYTTPISGMSVDVNYPDSGGCTPPSRVIVTVTYTYVSLFKYPGSAHNFQVSSQGRILY